MAQPTTTATGHQGKAPHLRSFLLTTSIKGVPRITRARSPLYRALWSVFVLLGSAITLYLVTQLFLQYMTNGVNMLITEERDNSLTFPDITLCNLNPLANTNMSQAHMKAYMDAAQAIRLMAAKKNINEGQLFDPAILFANVAPHQNNASVGQFLVTCQWDVHLGSPKPCDIADGQIVMYQASLGYCFTLNPPVVADFVSGFSAILYLDDVFQLGVPFYKLTTNTPLSLGAVLFVHQSRTLPDLSSGAVLMAGRNSRVNIRVQQRIQKPHPYSQCTGRKTLLHAPEYRYTQQTCMDLCYQATIIKSCGCISPRTLYIPSLTGYDGEPLCGVLNQTNLTQAIEDFITEQDCIRYVLSKQDRCDQHCHAACEEYRYELTTESTAWPHTALRLAFWREYVMNSTYSQQFVSYHDMWPNINDTPSTRAWKLEQVRNDDLLTSNFLQVQVSLSSTMVQRFRDEPSFTAEALIGTLGGTLNLWIGISFVTLFELLELLLQLCCAEQTATKTGPTADDVEKHAKR